MVHASLWTLQTGAPFASQGPLNLLPFLHNWSELLIATGILMWVILHKTSTPCCYILDLHRRHLQSHQTCSKCRQSTDSKNDTSPMSPGYALRYMCLQLNSTCHHSQQSLSSASPLAEQVAPRLPLISNLLCPKQPQLHMGSAKTPVMLPTSGRMRSRKSPEA